MPEPERYGLREMLNLDSINGGAGVSSVSGKFARFGVQKAAADPSASPQDDNALVEAGSRDPMAGMIQLRVPPVPRFWGPGR